MNKVLVVMPAKNAEKTLKKTYDDIPKEIVEKVILVDDGSDDVTIAVAKSLGITTYRHPQTRGYGGNQKTCYTMAINEECDVIVMIHPDYQYDSRRLKDLVLPIQRGEFDIMLGSRIRNRKNAIEGGMPEYKYWGNRFLTILQNIVLGQSLSEYHTGFRAYHRSVIESLPFHAFSDDFVFDQQILVSAVRSKFTIGEIPVPVRYAADSSSINFVRSVKYGFEIIGVLALFLLDASGIFKSKIFRHNATSRNL